MATLKARALVSVNGDADGVSVRLDFVDTQTSKGLGPLRFNAVGVEEGARWLALAGSFASLEIIGVKDNATPAAAPKKGPGRPRKEEKPASGPSAEGAAHPRGTLSCGNTATGYAEGPGGNCVFCDKPLAEHVTPPMVRQ